MFVAPPIRTKPKQQVYLECNACENLSYLTEETIVPFILYLYLTYSGHTIDSFRASCKTFEPVFINQPDIERQLDAFDSAEPYVFCFLFSSALKNASDSFMRFLKNKVKGLIRAVDAVDINYPTEEAEIEAFIPKKEVLAALRNFLDSHIKLRGDMMRLVLGMANPDEDVLGPLQAYASEILVSLKYIYMTGVKTIEEGIIEPSHPIITIPSIKSYVNHYERVFKKPMIHKFRQDWIYSAILDPVSWASYKSSESHKQIWIYASVLCSVRDKSYLLLTIDGHKIQEYAEKEPYCTIVARAEHMNNSLMIPSGPFSRQDFDAIGNLFSGVEDSFSHLSSKG